MGMDYAIIRYRYAWYLKDKQTLQMNTATTQLAVVCQAMPLFQRPFSTYSIPTPKARILANQNGSITRQSSYLVLRNRATAADNRTEQGRMIQLRPNAVVVTSILVVG